MSDTTPVTGLSYMVENQANKEEYFNNTIKRLDALLQITVRNVYNEPPEVVNDGERFLVGDNPFGVFTGHTNDIAQYIDNDWIFYVPKSGWLLYNETEDEHYKYIAGYNIWKKFIPKSLTDLKDTPTSLVNKSGMYLKVKNDASGFDLTNEIILTSANGSKFKLVVSDGGIMGVVNA